MSSASYIIQQQQKRNEQVLSNFINSLNTKRERERERVKAKTWNYIDSIVLSFYFLKQYSQKYSIQKIIIKKNKKY